MITYALLSDVNPTTCTCRVAGNTV